MRHAIISRILLAACAWAGLAGALPGQSLAPTASLGGDSSTLARLGPTRVLALDEYLAAVERSNPDYAAQRSAVHVADAQRRVARLFPNPVASVGYSHDISGLAMPGTTTPGISQTILLGGKIAARSAVADRAYEQATAQFGDVGRTLRAAAANAYVDALVAQLQTERRRQSAVAVDRLAEGNRARYRAGEIGEADLLQSRVEQLRFQADFLGAESNRRQALLALSALVGRRNSDTVYMPAPYREVAPATFDIHALIDSTLSRRPDVIAARRAADAARAGVRLARANRVSDVDVGFSMQHSSPSSNEIAPSPAWQSAALSLSFALPFTSLVNRGDVDVARYTAEQAEHAQASAEVRAESEVRQAHARYALAAERLRVSSGELLADAERVLAARTYSYQRGSAPLSDVLIAQRALNDVYVSYYEAVGEYLKALVGVQVAAGLGRVGF